MQFLGTQSQIVQQVKRLLLTSKRLRWAVAWASYDFPLFRLLEKHGAKIRQATIGIHFYQTHPDFMASFMNYDAVTLVTNPSGVFHPKLYFFEHHNGDWEATTDSVNQR